jgi:hypothetical protein
VKSILALGALLAILLLPSIADAKDRHSGAHSGSHSSKSYSGKNHGSKSHSSKRQSSSQGRASKGRSTKHSSQSRSGRSGSKAAAGVSRDSRGRIARSQKATREFKKSNPCPSTGKRSGACPGYVIDHVVPLKRGGADKPSNMQWQTKEAAKIKDRTE